MGMLRLYSKSIANRRSATAKQGMLVKEQLISYAVLEITIPPNFAVLNLALVFAESGQLQIGILQILKTPFFDFDSCCSYSLVCAGILFQALTANNDSDQ